MAAIAGWKPTTSPASRESFERIPLEKGEVLAAEAEGSAVASAAAEEEAEDEGSEPFRFARGPRLNAPLPTRKEVEYEISNSEIVLPNSTPDSGHRGP